MSSTFWLASAVMATQNQVSSLLACCPPPLNHYCFVLIKTISCMDCFLWCSVKQDHLYTGEPTIDLFVPFCVLSYVQAVIQFSRQPNREQHFLSFFIAKKSIALLTRAKVDLVRLNSAIDSKKSKFSIDLFSLARPNRPIASAVDP